MMNKILLACLWLLFNLCSMRLCAQVFVSETNYFDKETKCVAVEVRGNSNLIREAIGAYAKLKHMEPFWTKFFYISFQNVVLRKSNGKAGKNPYYKIHFKLSPTKLDSLYYLYLLVLDADNHFLPEKDYRSVYKDAGSLLLRFYNYYHYIFLVEKALHAEEKNYSEVYMRYAWLTADSTKVIRSLLGDTENLYKALERSKTDLRLKDSSFSERKSKKRQELRVLKHKMDSLKNLRQNNLKKYPL